MSVTHLDDAGNISRWMLHIWTMEVTCLDDWCYISGRWLLHIWSSVTYLDNGGYIWFGRWGLHFWTTEVTYLDDDCYISGRLRWHILMMTVTYLDDWSYISGRVLHIWTMEVTLLDDECYISGRVLHIWTREVTYLGERYISWWVLHIWTMGLHVWMIEVTYLDDDRYISGRVLYIWTMKITYLDEYYISGRWRVHVWTIEVTYLDDGGYIPGPVLYECYISEQWRVHVWRTVTYLVKASDAEHWCFLWSAPEQTVKQTNRDASDLRRHRAHYNVTVMCFTIIPVGFAGYIYKYSLGSLRCTRFCRALLCCGYVIGSLWSVYQITHIVQVWFGGTHDDVIKWKHFPCYWPFVQGIYRSPVNSPQKASDTGLWCFLWSAISSGEAGDFRRQHAHYEVTVMWRDYMIDTVPVK